jgi:hypothetical protein
MDGCMRDCIIRYFPLHPSGRASTGSGVSSRVSSTSPTGRTGSTRCSNPQHHTNSAADSVFLTTRPSPRRPGRPHWSTTSRSAAAQSPQSSTHQIALFYACCTNLLDESNRVYQGPPYNTGGDSRARQVLKDVGMNLIRLHQKTNPWRLPSSDPLHKTFHRVHDCLSPPSC